MRQLLDAGVNVGLGVDGTASNDCGSLIEEARQALFLQRSGGKVEGTCAADAEDTDQLLACSCQQGLKFSSGKPWTGGGLLVACVEMSKGRSKSERHNEHG